MPFEVLNLGKYERQYWQGVTFGEQRQKSRTEQMLYENLAFILKLYGASMGLSRSRGWLTCTARRARPWSTSVRWTRR
jgi:hypothetical protein